MIFCWFVFIFVHSPKQLKQHIQSRKRVMNLTVLRMKGQHGKMTPEKEMRKLTLG